MSVLVVVEREPGGVDELSLQALAFARTFADGEPLHALAVGPPGNTASQRTEDLRATLGGHGVGTLHMAAHDTYASYAPVAVARAATELVERLSPAAVIAAGSERGNEVLAHVAALLDQPLATNCIAASPGDPTRVTRLRWGGSLLEEANVRGDVTLLTVAPHAVAAAPAPVADTVVETFSPMLEDADLVVRVSERAQATTSGVSLADAKVVVSAGRGAGSTEGFAVVEELAALLGAAVGCSRAVTMAGWRPHTDQVGQTGTKIAPDIYIACGISGATQHMAGCKGAKALLAINTDPDAPIFASADYAVIGDLHQIVPAISDEIRRVRGL